MWRTVKEKAIKMWIVAILVLVSGDNNDNGDDGGNGNEDDADDEVNVNSDDKYIMMQCLFVTKNQHFLLGVSCNHLNHP